MRCAVPRPRLSGGRELRVRHGAGQRNIGANIANNFEKAAIARVFFDTTAVYAWRYVPSGISPRSHYHITIRPPQRIKPAKTHACCRLCIINA